MAIYERMPCHDDEILPKERQWVEGEIETQIKIKVQVLAIIYADISLSSLYHLLNGFMFRINVLWKLLLPHFLRS
jgi:hypothetical protein